MDGVKDCNEYEEYFIGTLKHAKVAGYADDVLTLLFDRQPIAIFFTNCYKKKFEDTASSIVGRKITLNIECEE